jgi:hypothetical protein
MLNVPIWPSSVTTAELDKCKVETVRTLQKILALESVPLFTQNTDLLKSESQKWFSSYNLVSGRSPSYLSAREYSRLSKEQDVDDQFEFRNALTVMADVRAYFQVAYKVLPFRTSRLSDEY